MSRVVWITLAVIALIVGVLVNSDDASSPLIGADAPPVADGGALATLGQIDLVDHVYGDCDNGHSVAAADGTGHAGAVDNPLCISGNDDPVTDCNALGGMLLGTASGSGGLSDANVTVTNPGASSRYLDIAANPGVVIHWANVKASNAYNRYVGDLEGLHGPKVNNNNLPTISHWWVCYTVTI